MIELSVKQKSASSGPAATSSGWPFGPMFKLLLLTGQRRDEIGTVERTEIESRRNREWTIPREKAKNDRAHEVHLSELAPNIIVEIPWISRPRADGAGSELSRYFFTTNGERPVSGFSKAKPRLDRYMMELSEPAGGGREGSWKAQMDGSILHTVPADR